MYNFKVVFLILSILIDGSIAQQRLRRTTGQSKSSSHIRRIESIDHDDNKQKVTWNNDQQRYRLLEHKNEKKNEKKNLQKKEHKNDETMIEKKEKEHNINEIEEVNKEEAEVGEMKEDTTTDDGYIAAQDKLYEAIMAETGILPVVLENSTNEDEDDDDDETESNNGNVFTDEKDDDEDDTNATDNQQVTDDENDTEEKNDDEDIDDKINSNNQEEEEENDDDQNTGNGGVNNSSPTNAPTNSATEWPTATIKTESPTKIPSKSPTPTTHPKTMSPTNHPKTTSPTISPTIIPTKSVVTTSMIRGNGGKKVSSPQPTKSPVIPPTKYPSFKPTPSPSKVKDPSQIYNNLPDAEKEYIQHQEIIDEEKEAAKISIGFIFLTLSLMICTAQQMSENPDGVYANVCRLAITVTSCIFKMILYPFRKVLGLNNNGGYAHHLVTTQDFRDPYSRSNRMEFL